MTIIERIRPDGRRFNRLIRVLVGVAAAAFAVMACYSLFKALRGDPDSYHNENLRSFSSAAALVLLMSHQLVRSDRARWRLIGGTFGFLVFHIWLSHAGAPVKWTTGAAACVILSGVAISVRALWPASGTPRAEWGAAVVTPKQARNVCLGMAVSMLGFALMFMSLVELRGAAWDVIAVVAVVTISFGLGAIVMLRLRRRIGQHAHGERSQ